MKVLLFLGSGVSYPTKLPSVDEITQKLLYCDWQSVSNSIFRPGLGEQKSVDWPVERQQKFLRWLSAFADDYFRAPERKLPQRRVNYEDLYYLIHQIISDRCNGIHNPAIGKFILEAQSATHDLCKDHLNERFNLADLAEESSRFIHFGVRHLLTTAKEPEGLGCVKHLATDDSISKLDIVTLNHDLLLEKVLGEDCADGFDVVDGDGRFYNPAWFDVKKYRIRLLKLHGSIHWRSLYRRSDEPRLCFIPLKASLLECCDPQGQRIAYDPEPVILIGSFNKLLDYRFGIFADLHFRFFQLLRKRSTIVMSGYGWNDIGINSWLSEWFEWSAKNFLVLLDEKQRGEIKIRINSSFQHRFDDLVESRRIILVPKWISKISANCLLKLLQKLRARKAF